MVVPTQFTTITLGILRTEFLEKEDNINRIVDQHLYYRTSTCTTRPALALQEQLDEQC
jgi:hypothetical protein